MLWIPAALSLRPGDLLAEQQPRAGQASSEAHTVRMKVREDLNLTLNLIIALTQKNSEKTVFHRDP